MTSDLPILEISGGASARGRAHGEEFRSRIHERKERMLAQSHTAVLGCDRFRSHFDLVKREAPDLLEELEGIASGAGLDVSEVLAMNSFEFLGSLSNGGCTALALVDENETYVAQNWDGSTTQQKELVVFRFRSDGYETLCVAPAGGLCWVGMNSMSLALTNTDLILKSYALAMPSQFIRRRILQQPGVREAIGIIERQRHPAGRTYVLGDRTGLIAYAEVAARCRPHVHLCSDRLAHANHPISPQLQAEENIQARNRIYPSSPSRYETAKRLIDSLEDRSASGLKKILKDKTGYPSSICKYATAEEPSQTVLSMVFLTRAREAHICIGNPSESDYTTIQLNADA
jgi:isopenicillin-N N-acyltransferase-like protein